MPSVVAIHVKVAAEGLHVAALEYDDDPQPFADDGFLQFRKFEFELFKLVEIGLLFHGAVVSLPYLSKR